jgi:hypothetical protein
VQVSVKGPDPEMAVTMTASHVAVPQSTSILSGTEGQVPGMDVRWIEPLDSADADSVAGRAAEA